MMLAQKEFNAVFNTIYQTVYELSMQLYKIFNSLRNIYITSVWRIASIKVVLCKNFLTLPLAKMKHVSERLSCPFPPLKYPYSPKKYYYLTNFTII